MVLALILMLIGIRSLGLESGGVDVEDDGTAAVDLGFSKWIQNIKGKPGFSFNDLFCLYGSCVQSLELFIQFHTLTYILCGPFIYRDGFVNGLVTCIIVSCIQCTILCPSQV